MSGWLLPRARLGVTASVIVLISLRTLSIWTFGSFGSTAGAVIGAFTFLGIEEVVWRNYLQVHTGVLGFLVVALLLFLPHGIVSIGRRVRSLRAGHV